MFGDAVLEALQGFTAGVGHVDVDVVFWVVPIDGQSTVLSARLVDSDGVILSQNIKEMGGVVVGEELEPSIPPCLSRSTNRLQAIFD